VTETLRTARLLLRQWRDDDIADFANFSADAAVMRFLVPFADRAATDSWVAAASTGTTMASVRGSSRFPAKRV
jgi:RimJ/RimL family protein N-acetyltransferase